MGLKKLIIVPQIENLEKIRLLEKKTNNKIKVTTLCNKRYQCHGHRSS
jgi:hypothetical protein